MTCGKSCFFLKQLANKAKRSCFFFIFETNNRSNQSSATTWWTRMGKKSQMTANQLFPRERLHLRLTSKILDVKSISDSSCQSNERQNFRAKTTQNTCNSLITFADLHLVPWSCLWIEPKKLPSSEVNIVYKTSGFVNFMVLTSKPNLKKQCYQSNESIWTQRSINKKRLKKMVDVDEFWKLEGWYDFKIRVWRKTFWKWND